MLCMTWTGTDIGSDEDDGGDDGEAASKRDIQRDLLMGHLLISLAQQSDMAPHALPALAATLADRGLLPRWLQACSWNYQYVLSS